MSFEEWAELLNRKGWLICSCYQVDDNHWFVSLRPKWDWTHCQASAKTPSKAIKKAWLWAKANPPKSEKYWRDLKKKEEAEKEKRQMTQGRYKIKRYRRRT